jgi:phage replication O-like protein O
MGYDKPNHTQTPNVLFDKHMAEMGEAELRVVLVVCRKTFGWHKEKDRISLSQLEKFTGMSRQGVLNGIEDAVNRGVLKKTKTEKGSVYSMVVNDVDPPSQRGGLAGSQRGRPTKESITKETIQNSDGDIPEKETDMDFEEAFETVQEKEHEPDILDMVAEHAKKPNPYRPEWLPADLDHGEGWEMWRAWCQIGLAARPSKRLTKKDTWWIQGIRDLMEMGYTAKHLQAIKRQSGPDDYAYYKGPLSLEPKLRALVMGKDGDDDLNERRKRLHG